MPKHIIGNDRTKTWSVDGDDQNWLLKPNGSITTLGVPALIVTAGSDDNRVRLLGDIEANGTDAMAVILRGQDNRLFLGAHGSIEGSIGIHDLAEGNRIISKGDITGLNIGIRSIDETRISVLGDVMGGTTGIELEGDIAGSLIRIGASGSVNGGARGIGMSSGTDVRIVNRGEISSDQTAIHITTGDSTIVNRGAIFGDIETGSGDDVIDTRKGSVSGEIHGGDGSDVYRISSSAIEIIEEAAYGYDKLYTSATYTLPDNLEEIFLTGTKNIDATGHDGHNSLWGNKGNNILTGLGGTDTMEGHGGNDQLTGGTDDDYFIFQPKSGVDTITDFENGTDFIYIWNYQGLDGFHSIESLMTQHGSDVWIQLTPQDRIIIKNVDVLDMDEADFGIDSDAHFT